MVVWGLRILALLSLVLLCRLANSGVPAAAFALAWGPNALFLVLTMRGTLPLPRVLVPVGRLEPALFGALGVGLVKRMVATRLWPLLLGMEPPAVMSNRHALLERTDRMTRAAEVCHGATFLLGCAVALCCLVLARYSDSAWILGFNLLLNGYPVMLQRANRWRVQQIRATMQLPAGRS